MTSAQPNRAYDDAPLSLGRFRAWLARAKPGERFAYYRGLLAIDRIKGTSALKEAERRNLDAVADHALMLACRSELHLVQERHGGGDYSYWAVARAPARSIGQVRGCFPIDQRSEQPSP